MNRLTSNFRLDPKIDGNGKVIIKIDNICMGLVICFASFLFAGCFIAMFVDLENFGDRYKLYREPFNFNGSEFNQSIKEINRMNKKIGLDVEPLKPIPSVRNDPGGFDWEKFGLLLVSHILILGGIIAGFAGLRIMFTGTVIIFDTRKSCVEWQYIGFYCSNTVQYTLAEVDLVLHEVILSNPRGFDWHGFVVSIINKDDGVVQLARSKKIGTLKEYSGNLQKLTGITIKKSF